MSRVVLHADLNHYYAAVEELYEPALRDLPLVVAGDPEARHGIILTKNDKAKRFGIQTGEAIWMAKQKCPGLVCTKPEYALYKRFSTMFKDLLKEYSDKVESYGLDEAFVDLSGPKMTMEEGTRIADEIRRRSRKELGLTASVGVADNKIYAKLGSDMKKPDATTTLYQADYAQRVWPLPVSELLFVGRATAAKLRASNIRTIGDLAQTHEEILRMKLGIVGLVLKVSAMGLDPSPVKPCDEGEPVLSVGNSSTAPHDIRNIDDAKCLLYMLAESVGARLRQIDLRCTCITVSARDTKLFSTSHQKTFKTPTSLTREIAEWGMYLYKERYSRGEPYRSLGLSGSSLVPNSNPQQLDLFSDNERRERELQLEYTADDLYRRFGRRALMRGVTLTDPAFMQINPREHDIHPVPFYSG